MVSNNVLNCQRWCTLGTTAHEIYFRATHLAGNEMNEEWSYCSFGKSGILWSEPQGQRLEILSTLAFCWVGFLDGSLDDQTPRKKSCCWKTFFWLIIELRKSSVPQFSRVFPTQQCGLWSSNGTGSLAVSLYEGLMRDSWGIHEGYMNPRGIHARHFRGFRRDSGWAPPRSWIST